MIIMESEEWFMMTKQHDHARISGEIANHFLDHLFLDERYREEILLGVREHDRGWIGLDEVPIWNDGSNVPFSFMDYPLYPKLQMYIKGLEEVEQMSSYAALLCSHHYSAFIRRSHDPECKAFMKNEIDRQNRLLTQCGHPTDDMVMRHVKLLQLCDEISLYICMNKSGAAKEESSAAIKFDTVIEQQIFKASWQSRNAIKLEPFPFKEDFSVKLKTKHVSKALRNEVGVHLAYENTEYTEEEFSFIKD
ncbi:DUF3891 family protein [Halalkalibacter urbisdiaboli]|uniref:DUF3891 family protein n=1 Tax=Halalkalibacter urbisdiaboli TaxID=1960589 RepID=UPI000B44C6AD|nr:DUF3891 family protein [Halalkalibacter urbisdiaboli]